MQETDKNKRLVYLDILNILSIFVVVAMHMNGSVHSLPLNKSWAFSLLVDTLCYFAVPIFVMISGAILMNYRQKYITMHTFIIQNNYTYRAREYTYQNFYTIQNNIYTRGTSLKGYNKNMKWLFSDTIPFNSEYGIFGNGFVSNFNETYI